MEGEFAEGLIIVYVVIIVLEKREKVLGRFRAGLVSGVWVLLLFVAVFGVVLNVPVVWGSGTIYIRADGSIDPPTAPITTIDNITYTFTDDIYDLIAVQRDNIVIDGAGYIVQGTGSGTGINLAQRTDVTVKNTRISLFDYGVFVNGVGEIVIEKTKIFNSESGIMIAGESNVLIKENTIKQNKNGIATDGAETHSGIVIADNTISSNTENGISITSSGYGYYSGVGRGYIYNVTVSSNNISSNGKNGIYLDSSGYGWHGTFYGYSGYGYIYNITISSNILSNNNGNGILLYSYGRGYYGSGNGNIYDVQIFSNTVSKNNGDGISLYADGFAMGTYIGYAYAYGYIYNTSLFSNTVSSNGANGILLYSTSSVGAGYSYSYIYYTSVHSNNVSSNAMNGIVAVAKNHREELLFDLMVLENIFSANKEKGIFIMGRIKSKSAGNSISKNAYGVFYLETRDNKACYNNIYDNTYGMNVTDSATVDAEYNFWGDASGPYHETLNPDGKGNSVNGNGIDLDFIPFLNSTVVGAPPKAAFFFTPERVAVGEIVRLDASASYDSDGFIVSYEWDFGDGNVTVVANSIVSHIYSSVGNYTINLRVIDNNGAGDDIAKAVKVKIGSTITVFAYPSTVEVGASVTLNGTITPTRTNVNVTISYRISGEPWSALANVLTDSDSHYSCVWNTTYVSTYEIKSSWLGDSETWDAESELRTITVKGEPKTWIVDDDGPADFHKIQEAINAARHPRDIISVRNGTYYENIVVNKTLTLIGENNNVTVIDGGGRAHVVQITANNVEISGFTMQNSGYYNALSGLILSHSNGSNVKGNIMKNNDVGIGIYSSSYCNISGNLMNKNTYMGIEIRYSSSNSFSGNTITNTYNFAVGISHSSHNSFIGNNMTNTGGVYMADSHDNLFSENNVKKNIGGFIILTRSSNNVISGNNIQESPIETPWSHAIKLGESSNNNILSDNDIIDCQNGIFLSYSSYNLISGNKIANSKRTGTIISASSSNAIYHNNFINNMMQVYTFESINVWDDGYPSGGNYWSDYVGVDLFVGRFQNETGSDGIGDIPYIIDTDNQDHYPLINPWIPGYPIAYFSHTPRFPLVSETVTFNASDSYDYEGNIISYEWNFGDGNITIVAEPIIVHVYTAQGVYSVNLTVTDNEGFRRSITRSIAVGTDSIPPTTVHDYDDLWHTTNFAINLTANDDLSGVAETYYKINDGPIQNISAHGQPLITTEGATNTLEYWSVDNAGNEEFPHKILTGIKLDKTYPTIETPSRTPEGAVLPDQSVKVSVNITDATSQVENVTLYYTLNNGTTWEEPIPMNYNSSTGLYEATIPPQQADTTVRFKITAYDHAGNNATLDGTEPYCVYQVIPEFPSTLIPPIFMIITLLAAIAYKRKHPPL